MSRVALFLLLWGLVTYCNGGTSEGQEEIQDESPKDIQIESSSKNQEKSQDEIQDKISSEEVSQNNDQPETTQNEDDGQSETNTQLYESSEEINDVHEKFGWIVSLGSFERASFYRPMCTGSLISVDSGNGQTEVILTSANCAREIQLEMKKETYYAILSGKDGGRFSPLDVPIVQVILHENHTSSAYDDQLRKHDIAIVKVEINNNHKKTLKRISLPDHNATVPTQSCYFSHLVREEEGDTNFGIYESNDPIEPLPSDQCEKAIIENGYAKYIPDTWLCIQNSVAYVGEKGSPYFTNDDTGPVLYGFKSSLVTYSNINEGAVLTNVPHYVHWIIKNAKN